MHQGLAGHLLCLKQFARNKGTKIEDNTVPTLGALHCLEETCKTLGNLLWRGDLLCLGSAIGRVGSLGTLGTAAPPLRSHCAPSESSMPCFSVQCRCLSPGGRSRAGVPVDEKGLSNLPKCPPGLVPQSPASDCAGHPSGVAGEAQRQAGYRGLAQKNLSFGTVLDKGRGGGNPEGCE